MKPSSSFLLSLEWNSNFSSPLPTSHLLVLFPTLYSSQNGLLSAPKCCPKALYMLPFCLEYFLSRSLPNALSHRLGLSALKMAFHFTSHLCPTLKSHLSHYLSYFCHCMYHYEKFCYVFFVRLSPLECKFCGSSHPACHNHCCIFFISLVPRT